MAACTEKEIKLIVTRCREAVARHGGSSPLLAEVRKYYALFQACPEHGAMVCLEAALDKLPDRSFQTLGVI